MQQNEQEARQRQQPDVGPLLLTLADNTRQHQRTFAAAGHETGQQQRMEQQQRQEGRPQHQRARDMSSWAPAGSSSAARHTGSKRPLEASQEGTAASSDGAGAVDDEQPAQQRQRHAHGHRADQKRQPSLEARAEHHHFAAQLQAAGTGAAPGGSVSDAGVRAWRPALDTMSTGISAAGTGAKQQQRSAGAAPPQGQRQQDDAAAPLGAEVGCNSGVSLGGPAQHHSVSAAAPPREGGSILSQELLQVRF